MTAVATPQAQLFDRLIAQGKDAEPWAYLVLSACDGEAGLARYLDDGVEPAKPKKPAKAQGEGQGGQGGRGLRVAAGLPRDDRRARLPRHRTRERGEAAARARA